MADDQQEPLYSFLETHKRICTYTQLFFSSVTLFFTLPCIIQVSSTEQTIFVMGGALPPMANSICEIIIKEIMWELQF